MQFVYNFQFFFSIYEWILSLLRVSRQVTLARNWFLARKWLEIDFYRTLKLCRRNIFLSNAAFLMNSAHQINQNCLLSRRRTLSEFVEFNIFGERAKREIDSVRCNEVLFGQVHGHSINTAQCGPPGTATRFGLQETVSVSNIIS